MCSDEAVSSVVSSLDDGCWLRCKYLRRMGFLARRSGWERRHLQLRIAASPWLAKTRNRTQVLRLKCYVARSSSNTCGSRRPERSLGCLRNRRKQDSNPGGTLWGPESSPRSPKEVRVHPRRPQDRRIIGKVRGNGVLGNTTYGHMAKNAPSGSLLNPERVHQQGDQNQLMVTSTKKLLFVHQKVALGTFFTPRNFIGKPSKRRIAKAAPYFIDAPCGPGSKNGLEGASLRTCRLAPSLIPKRYSRKAAKIS